MRSTGLMRNVVVPLDGSDLSLSVLGPLRRLLAPAGATTSVPAARVTARSRPGPRVVLVRAVHETGGRGETELRSAQRDLEAVTAELERLGLVASFRVMRGDPAPVILQCAEQASADLIAMATHGRGGVARLVLGSVAEEVLRGSVTPILLVNPHTMRVATASAHLGRILLAVDGSMTSIDGARLAGRVARSTGAEVIVGHVAGPGDGADEAPRARALLETVAPALGEGVAVRAALMVGHDAVAGLLTLVERERAELVVMTTHGRSGLARARLGSVAEEVVRRAEVPVLVQRAAAAP